MKLRIRSLLQLELKGQIHLQYNTVFRVFGYISFEFIRLAGRYDNGFVNAISKPGLWLQKITVMEPDDDMIEVGIASVEAVFDWKDFQEKNKEYF